MEVTQNNTKILPLQPHVSFTSWKLSWIPVKWIFLGIYKLEMKYHNEFHGISYVQYTMTLRTNRMKDYITLLETSL